MENKPNLKVLNLLGTKVEGSTVGCDECGCICGVCLLTQGLFGKRVTDDHVGVLVMSDVMIDVTHHLLHSCTMKI